MGAQRTNLLDKIWNYLNNLELFSQSNNGNHLPRSLRRKVKKLKRSALEAGVKNHNDVESLKLEWEACLSKADMIQKEAELKRLENEIRIVERDLNTPFTEREKRAIASLWDEYSKERQQIKEYPGALTERIQRNERESDQNIVDIQQEIELSGGAAPKKTLWDSSRMFFMVLGLITAFEYVPNYLAVRNFGAIDLINYLICIGYSLLMAITCDLTGRYLGERKDLPLKENQPALFSGLSGLVLVGIAIILRSRAETAELANQIGEVAQNASFIGNKDILALWNLSGWGIAILVSRRLHQHSKYWDLKTREAELAAEKDGFTTAAANTKKKLAELNEVFSARAYNQTITGENKLRERLVGLYEEKSKAEARFQRAKERYEALKNLGIAAIQEAFEKGRALRRKDK